MDAPAPVDGPASANLQRRVPNAGHRDQMTGVYRGFGACARSLVLAWASGLATKGALPSPSSYRPVASRWRWDRK
jgi:hypothetical protein